MRKRLQIILSAAIMIIGITVFGIRYYDFVSHTIYSESVDRDLPSVEPITSKSGKEKLDPYAFMGRLFKGRFG